MFSIIYLCYVTCHTQRAWVTYDVACSLDQESSQFTFGLFGRKWRQGRDLSFRSRHQSRSYFEKNWVNPKRKRLHHKLEMDIFFEEKSDGFPEEVAPVDCFINFTCIVKALDWKLWPLYLVCWPCCHASYVLYIYLCYVTCHTQWAWVTNGANEAKLFYVSGMRESLTDCVDCWGSIT